MSVEHKPSTKAKEKLNKRQIIGLSGIALTSLTPLLALLNNYQLEDKKVVETHSYFDLVMIAPFIAISLAVFFIVYSDFFNKNADKKRKWNACVFIVLTGISGLIAHTMNPSPVTDYNYVSLISKSNDFKHPQSVYQLDDFTQLKEKDKPDFFKYNVPNGMEYVALNANDDGTYEILLVSDISTQKLVSLGYLNSEQEQEYQDTAKTHNFTELTP